MGFTSIVEATGKAIEGVGVAVIVIGIIWASWEHLRQMREQESKPSYSQYRRSLGRSVILGLEFLVAGDIILTVATTPTFRSVGILAIIIAIRSFLSLELEMEVEGRWPWQGKGSAPGLTDNQEQPTS